MKIVVLDGGTLNPGDLSWDVLVNKFNQVELFNSSTVKEIVPRSQDAEILVVNKVLLDKSILKQLPKLKFIAVSATGYNNVAIDYCKANNITVSNIINYGSPNVAQHVFALLLSLTNKVAYHHQLIQQGEWKKRNVFSFWTQPLIELAGKNIGIIGYGNIGQKVAKMARGFDMNVFYHSKNPFNKQSIELTELLAKADVVSINTHLTADNHQLVNESFLNQMRSSAYLINTARGGLVDEVALFNALKKNKIAGAGLDVLQKEPADLDHPLLQLNNCVITPHNAWASVEARQRLMDMLINNIEDYINGMPKNLVN